MLDRAGLITLNVGCGGDEWGDVRVDLAYRTQTDVPSRLNLRADAHHLPFRDRAFEVTKCWHILEHLKDPHLALREINRVSVHAELRFPIRDGYKREFLLGLLGLSPSAVIRTAHTWTRQTHLWIISPSALGVKDFFQTGRIEVLFFLRKTKLFDWVRLPKPKLEWVVRI